MAGGILYASSWTDICNRALGRLGATLISNYETDAVPNATYCRLYLGDVIEEVYSEADWNGASKRVQLAQLVDPPAYGYSYRYQLPSDFLRLIAVDTAGDAYTIEGTELLTDAEAVYLRYVFRPADAGQVPRYLVRALAAGLAVKLTTPLSSSEQLIGTLSREYFDAVAGALEQAKRADARQSDEQSLAEELGYTWYDQVR